MHESITFHTSHREYPLPCGHWFIKQDWEHLLFLHYPVPKELIKKELPRGLELDTYQGGAWVSIIPFEVSQMQFRHLPFLSIPPFLEVNVRTYVQREGVKGVYFLHLDASSLLPILGGRMMTLPYYWATMSMKQVATNMVYESERKGRRAYHWQGQYEPYGTPDYPVKGSLDYWLSERYFLFTVRNGILYQAGIHHLPWKVQPANVSIHILNYLPFALQQSGLVAHYTRKKTALIWRPRKVKNSKLYRTY